MNSANLHLVLHFLKTVQNTWENPTTFHQNWAGVRRGGAGLRVDGAHRRRRRARAGWPRRGHGRGAGATRCRGRVGGAAEVTGIAIRKLR